jgi:hypothetical protein
MHYAVERQGGQLMVVFCDLLTGLWWEQTNAMPLQQPAPVDVLAVPQARPSVRG